MRVALANGTGNAAADLRAAGLTLRSGNLVDRGASFPETHTLAAGGWSRLVQVDMAGDYTLGVLFWSSAGDELRLTLVEGRPTALDANHTPVGFAFGSPEVLVERPASTRPLVSDLRYSACGDLFVAYESQDGVWVARSLDGARSFPAKTSIGTTSANAPQLFARMLGGKDVLDCLFVDASPAGLGWDLCLLRVEDDLSSGKSLHRIVEAKVVSGGTSAQEVEGIGWFGFDATELRGDLFVAVHTQRTRLHIPGLRGSAGGTGAIATSAPAAPPPVLLPGMTQPVPPVDPDAPHKLKVLRIE